MTAQAELADRLRSLLAAEPSLREVPMFGARAFMVRNAMVVCALKEGALLARVDADHHDELTSRPGAAQAVMGPGRDMGPGWVEVAAAAVATDADLSSWLDVTLEHNVSVTQT